MVIKQIDNHVLTDTFGWESFLKRRPDFTSCNILKVFFRWNFSHGIFENISPEFQTWCNVRQTYVLFIVILFCKSSFIYVYWTNYRRSHREIFLNQPSQQNLRKNTYEGTTRISPSGCPFIIHTKNLHKREKFRF